MSHHQYEIAEYGEPLDLEDKGLRLRIFPHGKRCKLQLEPLNRPIVVTRPQISIDTDAIPTEDKGRPTS